MLRKWSNMKQLFKKILSKLKKRKRVSFTELFDHFQQLIKENNTSMEIISNIGEKLSGEYIFDKHFIDTQTNALFGSVYRMIYHLESMAPGKYTDLFYHYKKIRSEIEEELKGNIIIPKGKYVIPYSKIKDELEDAVGGKNTHLGVARNILSVNIPEGFAITTKGFSKIVKESKIGQSISHILSMWQQNKISSEDASKKIREIILAYKLPRDLCSEVINHINKIKRKTKGNDLFFAVRSSCIGEDSEHSFAGIYKSFLGVPAKEVLNRYKEVIISTYSERALEYRKNRDIMESEIAMAVGCQKMIRAQVSGVIYTLDPFNIQDDKIVIAATFGLGEELVGGSVEADRYYIARTPPHDIIGMDIVNKPYMKKFDFNTMSIIKGDVPEKKRDKPCLSLSQIRELVRIGIMLEKYFKHPQDIEFTYDEQDNLVLLQTRRLQIEKKRIQMKCDLSDLNSFKKLLAGQGEIVREGVAIGKVYKVTSSEDLDNVPEECILVTTSSSPMLAKVIKKVNGIITDIGSPIGHLATIAREFRVPMIINTKNATKILKNGQKITLNATDNVVYEGYIKELCYYEFAEEKFEEIKEYRLLKRIYKRISPLNLVDPTGDNFRIENCKTFHDIIRFIHEKAVQELIDQNYYTDPAVSNSSIKLKLNIPLDLKIIDTTRKTTDSSSELDIHHISSLPLKYFLNGVCSENVWSTDPIGVDFKSFMSSMNKTFAFEMADPRFVGQNLAVISNGYANISLRLGYHFTMIDTLACDNPHDNYIYFRFFGGVTEDTKRTRRAKLISNILIEQDFLTEIKGDLVVARLKGLPKEEILEKIYVLGILVGFTRQLDVKMVDEHQVTLYSKKFHEILLQQNLKQTQINL